MPWFAANISVLVRDRGSTAWPSSPRPSSCPLVGVTLSFLVCGFIMIAGKWPAPTLVLPRGLRLQRQPRVCGDLVDPDGGLRPSGDHGGPGHGHGHGGAGFTESRRRSDPALDPRRCSGCRLKHPRLRGDHEGPDVDHVGHCGPDDHLPVLAAPTTSRPSSRPSRHP